MAEKKKTHPHFPKDFLWGASISTHQVEGGNHNQWSKWELETAQVKASQAPYLFQELAIWNDIKKQATRPENYVSGRAADHFNRYKEDFAIAKSMHLNTLRTGLEWSRIEPAEGEFNEAAVQHYRQYLQSLIDIGITPVLTLWHWTMPVWLAEKGGFEKARNIKYYTRYVRYVTETLGDLFSYVITLNEPTVYTSMSYHEERWPPEMSSKLMMVIVLRNLAKAHRRAYKVIKKALPEVQVGLAHNCAYYYAGDDSIISRISARVGHFFGNEIFIDRVKRHQDFFGLNYYFAHRITGTRVHNPHVKTNDLGWDMQPDKVGSLLSLLYARYKKPVIITENGTADMHDQYRQWWIAETVKAMDVAMRDGVNMAGYIHWSLLDNFEWAEGFWPRFGLVEVDYKTLKRTPRPSALWYSRLVKTMTR